MSSRVIKIDNVKILMGDITTLAVDAIVNAANTSLLGGGGVDGAIHRAAGHELTNACRDLRGCRRGEVKLTEGYLLPARYVIHTVGPVWQGGEKGEMELLRSCYRNALEMMRVENFTSVAFPAISCGIYGFPIDLACSIAWEEVQKAVSKGSVEVTFCCFEPSVFQAFKRLSQAEQGNANK